MFARRKILAFLKKQNSATAVEIATALGVTPANVRHHLAELQADGLVEAVSLRGLGRRGRPQKVYRLGRTLRGENLAALLDALLRQMPPEEAKGRLEAAGRSFADPLPERSLPLMRRLAQAVERLNEKNYQARWEATSLGPRLVLGNCPYAAVIENHPALCRMDTVFIQTLLGTSVEQTARLERTERGNLYCAFYLRG